MDLTKEGSAQGNAIRHLSPHRRHSLRLQLRVPSAKLALNVINTLTVKLLVGQVSRKPVRSTNHMGALFARKSSPEKIEDQVVQTDHSVVAVVVAVEIYGACEIGQLDDIGNIDAMGVTELAAVV